MWKGHDFALLELDNSYGKHWTDLRQKGNMHFKMLSMLRVFIQAGLAVVPICLPSEKFALDYGKDVVLAGHGRRRHPFCTTDILGPEAFQMCGSPQQGCTINSISCGLDFLYQGILHLPWGNLALFL